ncbi:MAG: hypothetical protein SFW35_02905 [Chitinophagales bacterium]|nr:hypothetical protein [Chitinophagales bacterium]
MTAIFPSIFQTNERLIDKRISVCDYYIANGENLVPLEESTILPNVSIIQTPGYSPSSCCYLYLNDRKRYLFVGHTLQNIYGNWQYDISKGSRSDLKESLQLLALLEPDVVISSVSINYSKYEKVSSKRWQQIIEACRSRIDNGFYH